jgi:DNA-binding HxlR family transcriptional regulator
MALLDLLGRRWVLRIVWELREARLTFRALQNACGGVSPTVLNERLKELREGRIVDLIESHGYELTPFGRELRQALGPLTEWAERWARVTVASRTRINSQRE